MEAVSRLPEETRATERSSSKAIESLITKSSPSISLSIAASDFASRAASFASPVASMAPPKSSATLSRSCAALRDRSVSLTAPGANMTMTSQGTNVPSAGAAGGATAARACRSGAITARACRSGCAAAKIQIIGTLSAMHKNRRNILLLLAAARNLPGGTCVLNSERFTQYIVS